MFMLNRRAFLGSISAGAPAIVALPFVLQSLRATAAEIVAEPLSGNTTLITGAGGNVVVHNNGDALVLVDSGAPEFASELARLLRTQFNDRPVELIFNTHWHPQHTGGNESLAAGAAIVAHENTRLWMGAEHYVDWEDKTYAPRADAALPTQTFYASELPPPLAVDLKVEYGHLPQAHTDGDIYVYLSDENVLMTGDVLTVNAYPTPDHATGGWIGGLISATQRLLEVSNKDTIVVPGSGGVQAREALERQLAMLTAVRERVEELMRGGHSAEEMIAAGVTAEFDTQWGDPTQFISNVYDGLWWGGRLSGGVL